MQPVAAAFRSPEGARHGIAELRRAGFSPDDISVVFPSATEDQAVSETVDAAGTDPVLGLGDLEKAPVATAIPGVGPVVTIGLGGAGMLGLDLAAQAKSPGRLPADEVFLYRDALRRGEPVVVVMANGKREAERARQFLADAGAESLDAVRESCWLALREHEKQHYEGAGGDFDRDEAVYREGFEAALRCPAQSYEDVASLLRGDHPSTWNSPPFREGFERGLAYRETSERAGVRSAS